jgi:hypothetical protein
MTIREQRKALICILLCGVPSVIAIVYKLF